MLGLRPRAERINYTVGNCLFRGLNGLRQAMEAQQDASFEGRIAAYEQAMMTGQTLDHPTDATCRVEIERVVGIVRGSNTRVGRLRQSAPSARPRRQSSRLRNRS